jgi:ATP-binding protein involved in chromosome partitioning
MQIPLDPSIRDTTDRGTPIVVSQPDSYSARLYIDMAQKLLDKIKGDKSTQGPKIVFEE